MLLEIHKRLQQIEGVLPDVTFGGVSILAVGDLYQLLMLHLVVLVFYQSETSIGYLL